MGVVSFSPMFLRDQHNPGVAPGAQPGFSEHSPEVLPAFLKLHSHHRQNSCRESCILTPPPPQHFMCFIQKNCLQINFNRSVTTNETFRSDWNDIKRIQVKCLFD